MRGATAQARASREIRGNERRMAYLRGWIGRTADYSRRRSLPSIPRRCEHPGRERRVLRLDRLGERVGHWGARGERAPLGSGMQVQALAGPQAWLVLVRCGRASAVEERVDGVPP